MTETGGPPEAQVGPRYRGLGVVLTIISAPLLVAGIVLQFYPKTRVCTDDFFGDCLSYGQGYPYSGAGDVLLFFFVLALLFGLVFYFWRPSTAAPPPPRPVYVPFTQYVPIAAPPPPYTPGPPPGYAASGQVVVNVQAPAAPQIMMHCRNCGSLYDATKGRCDKCGAPTT